ncbi:hypothetical protein nbrc107696_24640 [Gordonia spumicola]|uniref:Secreted protein n=1 Tax=Gordonia spumicola TaxID=589161 RepID=A0A7I9V9E5_9ACTN|nr:hypothetical protein [Gordonia spumicola]GEE02018.1 hypothetical protein nbrc107696_24640 [Gordonia spumicola]
MNVHVTSTVTRRLAAVTATAGILAAAGIAGAGAASAEEVGPGKGSTNAATISRTVSGDDLVGGSIPTGSRITITNTVTRTLGWLIYSVRDNHPSCLQPVDQTSVWKVSGGTYTNNPDGAGTKKPSEVTTGDGWVQIKASGASSWQATPLVWSQDYIVACDPGDLNTGGVETTSTNLIGGTKANDIGPAITVTKKSGGGIDPGDIGDTGSLSTGSLGGLFGSS